MIIGTTRLEAFSDGVIAIVITIMVLELKLPDLNRESPTDEIVQQLRQLVPYFITYAFSFMMIGIFRTNHHHLFHLLEKTDDHLVWQNFVCLFMISLVPFATSVLGANPFQPFSVAIYGLVMLLATLSFFIMRQYSMRNKLLHKDQDKVLTEHVLKVSTRAWRKSIVGTFIYLASIPLAYVHVYLSYLCFLIPPVLFFIPEGIDNEQLAEKVAEKNK